MARNVLTPEADHRRDEIERHMSDGSVASERSRDCDVLIAGGAPSAPRSPRARGSAVCAWCRRGAAAAASRAAELRRATITALANGSQQILAGLDLWPERRGTWKRHPLIPRVGARPLRRRRLAAHEERVPALGYTVENDTLESRAVGTVAARAELTVLAPAKVTALAHEPDFAELQQRCSTRRRRNGAREARSRGQRRSLRRSRCAWRRKRPRTLRPTAPVIFNCSTEAPLRAAR